jgi:hypothetical protein
MDDENELEPEDVLRFYENAKELIIAERGISGLFVVIRRFDWANVGGIRDALSENGFQERFVAQDGGSDGAIIEALAFEERDLDIDIDAFVLRLFGINGRSCKIVVKQLCPIRSDTYGGEGE